MPDDNSSSDDSSTDDNTTQSASTRWDYTNDVVTIAIVLNALAVLDLYVWGVATGQVDPPALGTPGQAVQLALAGAILMMAIWLWGKDAFEAVRGLRGGR